MPRRTGSADLPLNGGHVPSWLAARMSRLGAVISAAIIHHYGRDERCAGSQKGPNFEDVIAEEYR